MTAWFSLWLLHQSHCLRYSQNEKYCQLHALHCLWGECSSGMKRVDAHVLDKTFSKSSPWSNRFANLPLSTKNYTDWLRLPLVCCCCYSFRSNRARPSSVFFFSFISTWFVGYTTARHYIISKEADTHSPLWSDTGYKRETHRRQASHFTSPHLSYQ